MSPRRVKYKDITDDAAAAKESLDLSKAIQPMLVGKDPTIIGGALADLLSIWLAGHPREIMGTILVEHITAVKLLELQSRRAIEQWARENPEDDGVRQ
jgi:hypothetical protein